jgi:2-dehydropantoate 2-reductase
VGPADDAGRLTMDIALVGPGAVGSTLAACLHEAGRPVRLHGRQPAARLCVRLGNGSEITVPGPVLSDPAQVTGPAELVLLAVKATQVPAAAPWLAALCGAGTALCVLQNGIEHHETVGTHAGRAAVVPAIVWFAAETQPGGWVRLRDSPRLTLPRRAGSDRVAAAFAGSRCSVELSPDFLTDAWSKLLLNAVAGLMALTGRRSGMFRRPDVAALAGQYLDECLAVALADGAKLPASFPAQAVALFQAGPPDGGTSILADRVSGRPLEWETRNGIIRRRAARHGLATPISDVLVPLLAAASDGPG